MNTELDLFGTPVEKENKMRSLGLWQPFCSLMLPPYDKIETRKVKKGKKPPFPLGEYLFYTTEKITPQFQLFEWCGAETMLRITELLKEEPTRNLSKYAIGTGQLKEIRKMILEDEERTFIKFVEHEDYDTWCLIFEDRHRIEPFEWKFGKQGVGFVPDSELKKIKHI